MSVAVLDGQPETASGRNSPVRGEHRGAATCAQCGASFGKRDAKQLFCCLAHRRAFNNRWLKRGAVLAPLVVADRITRGATRGDIATGRRARADAQQLMQRWVEEDRAAGRMPADAYLAFRYRHGLVEVVR